MTTVTLPDEIKILADAFQRELSAEVEAEQVEGTSRYRFRVVSPAFEGVAQMDRQDRAWEIVDRVLGRDGFLKLTLVLAYAPSDLESKD